VTFLPKSSFDTATFLLATLKAIEREQISLQDI
jgi:hypothetical protein